MFDLFLNLQFPLTFFPHKCGDGERAGDRKRKITYGDDVVKIRLLYLNN